jgi:hypothetical protein
MLRSYQGFFNQNATFTPDTLGGQTNKFDRIASLSPGDTTTAWLTLSCMYINAYGRSIRASEYGTNVRPLTSILVNRDNIRFTSPFGTGLGCSNYTDFFNAIAARHNLYSRMYPMGNTNPQIQYPYDIAANVSVTETFSMAFVETSRGITNFTNTGPTYLYYIETVEPMIVRTLIAKPGVNGGLESLKTASNINRDSFWQNINLAPPV